MISAELVNGTHIQWSVNGAKYALLKVVVDNEITTGNLGLITVAAEFLSIEAAPTPKERLNITAHQLVEAVKAAGLYL